MSAERRNVPAVVEAAALVTTSTLLSALVVPVMIADAGDRAARRFLDFFAASIEKREHPHAYYRAVCSFFAWLEQHGIHRHQRAVAQAHQPGLFGFLSVGQRDLPCGLDAPQQAPGLVLGEHRRLCRGAQHAWGRAPHAPG